jgi:hypothetical protein
VWPEVSATHAKKELKSLPCLPEASAGDGAGFLEAKQRVEVEIVAAVVMVSCLLLVLGDFSKHPANFLSKEPAIAPQCITFRLGGSFYIRAAWIL